MPIRKTVADLPGKVHVPDSISVMEEDECRNFCINKVVVALEPCGHGKYCKTCVNRVRSDSLRKGRLPRCLHKKCLFLVVGWVLIININGTA